MSTIETSGLPSSPKKMKGKLILSFGPPRDDSLGEGEIGIIDKLDILGLMSSAGGDEQAQKEYLSVIEPQNVI